MYQVIYKFLFWFGCAAVLLTSMIRIPGNILNDKISYGNLTIRFDYMLHLVVYFLIVVYFLAGQWKGLVLYRKNALLKFIMVILFLATVTEVVQLWVPARTFNPLDWLSNVAGVILGVGVKRLLGTRRTTP
jgi:VanZ family protein